MVNTVHSYLAKSVDFILSVTLRRSLADCGNISVSKEVADVMYNIPELFVDDNEPDFSILF